MSWGYAFAGKGEELPAKVAKAVESTKQYQPGANFGILDCIAEAARKFGEQYPDKMLTFETSGHTDSTSGSFTMAGRVWQ